MASPDEHEKRMIAFLALIRYAENGKQDEPNVYRHLYGNGHFANLATHPNRKVTRWGHTSTAAGAYAIVKETYDEAVRHGVVHDFYERSQDEIAMMIITRQGAASSIWDGNLDAAFSMLNRTWAALPGGSQQEVTDKEAKAYFWIQLGEPVR